MVDRVAEFVITLGGLLVVLAVLGIGVYLIAVVLELFRPGSAEEMVRAELRDQRGALFVDVDEHQSSMIRLFEDGLLQFVELETGDLISESAVIPEGRTITTFVRGPRDGYVAIGYDEGAIQLGAITFGTEFLSEAAEPDELRELPVGQRTVWEGAVAERTPIGQIRLITPLVDLASPTSMRVGDGAVERVDYYIAAGREYLAAMRSDGTLALNDVRKRPNLAGGPPRISLRSYELPYQPPEGRSLIPDRLFVTGDGASVLTVWNDGFCQRYDTSSPDEAALAETVRLVDEGRRLTAATKLLGGLTLIVGDDAGALHGYFSARNELADTPDQRSFVRAHELAPQGEAITAIGVSSRGRTFVAGDAGGGVTIRNMTSHALIAALAADIAGPIDHVALMPKVDGFMAVNDRGDMEAWTLAPRHPEATFHSLFQKVWYEGDPAPSYNYQSSSGDDAAEAKFNLVPLIFGTVKATIYAMLISVPLGILGAIYTSEFLSPRLRTAIKPSIEMMASLPSVVLGFIAAMVLAPLARDWLPGVLLAFVGVPIGVLLAAYLWQFAPVRIMSRASAGGRLVMIIVVTLLAGFASLQLGPVMQSALFQPSDADALVRAGSFEPAPRDAWPEWVAQRSEITSRDARRLRSEGLYYRNGMIVRPVGSVDDPEIQREFELHGFDQPDIRAWLDGVIGGPWSGWFLIAFPASAILVSILITRIVNPRMRDLERGRAKAGEAAVELLKFALALTAMAVTAAVSATALTALGLDARDSVFGSFEQRNTLVVGIAMAVAVIPIIYTISDDAMTSVPDSLRSASLGAGATRWQTAVRVVLPVALSGVFSACMIGLGRAAGETMIVLMATGNTPIMSWSIFDGLRTLSANIAVELPEAPKDSTHYRVLFLCGLVLFILTFTINTAAEIIRQRVRKKSEAL